MVYVHSVSFESLVSVHARRSLSVFARTFHSHTLLERIAGVVLRARAHRTVIVHLAAGIQAASARARIHTALVHARLVQIALGAGRALRPAGGRHSDVVGQARAHRMLVDVATLAVRSARRRLARIGVHRRLDADLMAAHRRAAGETGQAAAVRRMVGHMALGIGGAHADARIVALLVATGARLWAVGVHDALRTAFGVRIAKVFGQAGARAGAVALVADGVDAARRRIARFDGLLLDDF